jgi:hypothetical protein
MKLTTKEKYQVVPKLRAAKSKQELRQILFESYLKTPLEANLNNEYTQARLDKDDEKLYVISQALYKLRYLTK